MSGRRPPPPPQPPPQSGGSGATTKRLLKELARLSDPRAAADDDDDGGGRGPIERLGPVAPSDLLHWECVLSGRGLGGGYDGGRWLLDIVVPDGTGGGGSGGAYPLAPPAVRFVTRICAANVGFEVGAALCCLSRAWLTPPRTRRARSVWIC